MILRGGLFGNPVPAGPGLRSDNRRQDAAAERRIDLLEEAVKDHVGVAAEGFFFVSDADFFKLPGKDLTDIGKIGQAVFIFHHNQGDRILNAFILFHIIFMAGKSDKRN